MVCSKIAASELTHRGTGLKPGPPAKTAQESAALRMKVSHCRSITATCTCMYRRVFAMRGGVVSRRGTE